MKFETSKLLPISISIFTAILGGLLAMIMQQRSDITSLKINSAEIRSDVSWIKAELKIHSETSFLK